MHTHKNMHHPAVTNITMAEIKMLGCSIRELRGYNYCEVELDIREVYVEDELDEEFEELLEDPYYWERIERPSWERY